MKKLACLVLALLLPLSAWADEAKSSAVVSSYRIWVRDGHTEAFKKALTAHVQKYHTGNWKWRVYEVMSGPDSGAFQFVEGPLSWTVMEERGDLGKEHNKHYETALTPHIEKTSATINSRFDAEHSTTQAGAFSDKVVLNHVLPKPGRIDAYLTLLKSYKPVWEKRGMHMVVWQAIASGDPSIATAYRLKNGLKDLEPSATTFRASFDEVHGAGAFDKVQDEYARIVEKRWSEIIEYRAELSSK